MAGQNTATNKTDGYSITGTTSGDKRGLDVAIVAGSLTIDTSALATEATLAEVAVSADNIDVTAQNIANTQTDGNQKTNIVQGGVSVSSAAPLYVSLANTGANATAVKVDGSAVTQPISGSVTVTQATGTNLHTVIDSGTVTNLSQLGGSAIAMNTGVRSAGTQRVTIATDDVVPASQSGTWNITNVSGTVSLPTGAATSANQSSELTLIGAVTETAPASDTASSGLNGRLQRIAQRITSLIAQIPAALGQTTMANSMSVAIASNQSAVPISQAAVLTSGNITTQNLVPAGTATAGSAVEATITTQGMATVQVTGTYTGALSLQYTVDGSTWVTHATGNDAAFFNVNAGTFAFTIASATTGIFRIPTAGAVKVRVTALAAVTGTAVVTINAAQASIPAPSSQNINQNLVGGATITVNNGVAGSGTQRVVIASDQTAYSVNATLGTETTKVIGVTGHVPSAVATNGLSSAASTAAATNLVVKASAGRLYMLTGYNGRASSQFIQIHNTTSLPADTAVPIYSFIVPAQSNFSLDYGVYGRVYGTGITVCNSSTQATKTVGSADCWFNAEYL